MTVEWVLDLLDIALKIGSMFSAKGSNFVQSRLSHSKEDGVTVSGNGLGAIMLSLRFLQRYIITESTCMMGEHFKSVHSIGT